MSQHRYGFVKNNPINFVDPEGFNAQPLSSVDILQGKTPLMSVEQNMSPAPKPGSITQTQCKVSSQCNGWTVKGQTESHDWNTDSSTLTSGQLTIGRADGGLCFEACLTQTTTDAGGNTSTSTSGVVGTINYSPQRGVQAGLLVSQKNYYNGQPVSQWSRHYATSDEAWVAMNYGNVQELIDDVDANQMENVRQSRQVMKTERTQIIVNQIASDRVANQQMAMDLNPLRDIDYKLLDYAGAYGGGAVGGFESDVESILDWRGTLVGLGNLVNLAVNTQVESDLMFADSMGYFDNDPNKGVS